MNIITNQLEKEFKEIKTVLSVMEMIADGYFGTVNSQIQNKLRELYLLVNNMLNHLQSKISLLLIEEAKTNKHKDQYFNIIYNEVNLTLKNIEDRKITNSNQTMSIQNMSIAIQTMKQYIFSIKTKIDELLKIRNLEAVIKTKFNPTSIDLDKLIRKQLAQLSELFPKIHIKLNSPTHSSATTFNQDAQRVEIIIRILLENACYWIQSNQINIKIQFDSHNNSYIQISYALQEVAFDYLPFIFDLDSQLKFYPIFGCSILFPFIHILNKQCKGQIKIESDVKKLTTVTIYLPNNKAENLYG